MSWVTNKKEIDEFIKYNVLSPGVKQEGFCDAMTYEEAVEMAMKMGEDGKILLESLLEMKELSLTA
jgi:hypothetical protein